ncbi:MAG: hypothetical protein ACR2G2_10455 [Pseudonocardia sp.]
MSSSNQGLFPHPHGEQESLADLPDPLNTEQAFAAATSYEVRDELEGLISRDLLGPPSRYEDYVATGPSRCEVEHIWANHAERHTDEFAHAADFAEYRNRIGGLLLLPKSFNGVTSISRTRPSWSTTSVRTSWPSH